jgi:hypothetical protein
MQAPALSKDMFEIHAAAWRVSMVRVFRVISRIIIATVLMATGTPHRTAAQDAQRPLLRLLIHGAPSADSARVFAALSAAAARAWNVDVVGPPDSAAMHAPGGGDVSYVMQVNYVSTTRLELLQLRVLSVATGTLVYRANATITGTDRHIEVKEFPPLQRP